MLFPLSGNGVPRVSSRNDETAACCVRTALVVKICQVRRNKVDHLIRKMCSQLELYGSPVEDLFDLRARFIPICKKNLWCQRRRFTNGPNQIPVLLRCLDLLYRQTNSPLGEPQLYGGELTNPVDQLCTVNDSNVLPIAFA